MRQRKIETQQKFDNQTEQLYSDFIDVINELQNQQQIHKHMLLYNQKLENDQIRLKDKNGLQTQEEQNLRLQIEQVSHEIRNKAVKNMDINRVLEA